MTTAIELGRPVEILLIEDNPGDVRLARESLKEAKAANRLHVVGDGDRALRYLRRQGQYAGASRPDLILLDLNLPGQSGHEILAAIKGDEDFEEIPVVVLTSSSCETDILESYRLKANCYVTKPARFDQLVKLIQQLETFWFTVVQLPRR